MKRYIKNNESASPLQQEAQRVYDKLETYPDVIDMVYVDETDSYCIRFNNDAEDVGWIWREMEDLGYKHTLQDEDAVYWSKGKDFRAWMYGEPDLELYISR